MPENPGIPSVRNLAIYGLVLSLATLPRAQSTFQRTSLEADHGERYRVRPRSDGTHILTGRQFVNLNSYDFLLAKLASDGSVSWSRTYDLGHGDDESFDVIPTRDGGYLMAGMTYNGVSFKTMVVKTDNAGDVVFSKSYGYGMVDAVDSTGDGGFVLSGRTDNTADGRSFLMKIDATGGLVWGKSYATGPAFSVSRTPDGGYMLYAASALADTTASAYSRSPTLLKIASDGSVVWARSYVGLATVNVARGIAQVADGGYAITGALDYDPGQYIKWAAFLLRTDADGGVISTKVFKKDVDVLGEIFMGAHITGTSDGGYLLTASDGTALKATSSGTLSWARSFLKKGNSNYYNSTELSGGGYLLHLGGYLHRTDADGKAGCRQKEVAVTTADTTLTANALSLAPSDYGTAEVLSPDAAAGGYSSASVFALPAKTMNVSGATTFCAGAQGPTLTPAGTVVGWNTGETTQSLLASGAGRFAALVASASLCVDSTDAVTTTTLTAPDIPGPLRGPDTVCAETGDHGYAVTPVPGATSYQWILPIGSSLTYGSGTDSVQISIGSVGGNIEVMANNTCGNKGDGSGKSIHVLQIPGKPGTITGPATVCRNATGVRYTIGLVANGVDYQWTVPAGAVITSGQGTRAITVDFGTASGEVGVAASNTCGSGTTSTLAVAVSGENSAAAPGAISGATAICPNATWKSYSVSPVTGADSYQWTVPEGAVITIGQGTPNITVDYGGAGGEISVQAVHACGTSGNSTLSVATTGQPMTTGAIAGPAALCPKAKGVGYRIAPVSGAASYAWSVPFGATIVTGAGTDSITVDFGTVSGKVSVAPNGACGTGTGSSLPVTVAGSTFTPPAGIEGETKICSFASGKNYSVAPVSGAVSYIWEVPSMATLVSGQGTPRIMVDFGLFGGAIQCRTVSTCGIESHSASLVVDYTLAPSQPFIEKSGDILSAPEAAAYLWYMDGKALAQDTARTLRPEKSGHYQVQVANAEGCLTLSDSLKVEVKSSVITRSPDGRGFRLHLGARFGWMDLGPEFGNVDAIRLEIRGIQGRILWQRTLDAGGSPNGVGRELDRLPEGLYIVKVEAVGRTLLKRVVIGK